MIDSHLLALKSLMGIHVWCMRSGKRLIPMLLRQDDKEKIIEFLLQDDCDKSLSVIPIGKDHTCKVGVQ